MDEGARHMTTTYAFLGQFGDAIEFIFEGRTSQEGTQIGGSQFLDLTWEHLKLTLVAMAVACAIAVPARAVARPHRQGRASSPSAFRTSAARCPAWR